MHRLASDKINKYIFKLRYHTERLIAITITISIISDWPNQCFRKCTDKQISIIRIYCTIILYYAMRYFDARMINWMIPSVQLSDLYRLLQYRLLRNFHNSRTIKFHKMETVLINDAQFNIYIQCSAYWSTHILWSNLNEF